MNKLNNQRKITHRAQTNPMKSDLMTENMHRNVSGTAENESDLRHAKRDKSVQKYRWYHHVCEILCY